MSEAEGGAKWLPYFIPPSSHQIVGLFDVDSNQVSVEFEFSPGTFDPPAVGFSRVDPALAKKVLSTARLKTWSVIGSADRLDVYEHCEDGRRGTLLIDEIASRAYYWLPSHVGFITC